MAQVRQENEKFQDGQISCYSEHGLKAVKTMGGSVGFVDLPQDSATQDLLEKAAADCNARFPLPQHLADKTLTDTAYQRMLDTRACIVAHGFDVSEPPTFDTWKDSDWQSAWNPYAELVNATNSLAKDKLFALANACPQSGPNFEVLAPTGDS